MKLVKGITDKDLQMLFAFKIGVLPRFKILYLRSLWRRNPARYQSNYENVLVSISLLAEALSFLTGIRHIEKRPFKWIGLRMGPSIDFKNISLWEFALAEKCYRDFKATQNINDLSKMASVLYRYPSIIRAIKYLFVKSDIRKSIPEAPYIIKIPDWKAIALYAWFDTFQSMLPQKYPAVFSKSDSSDFNPGASPWADIIFALSGDIPGNEEAVGALPFFLIMERLEFNARQAKELEK
jgi:hypothetical protein